MRFTPKSEKEVAEAGLLSKGTYDFEVVEANDKQSKAGNDMVELICQVYDSEGRGRKIFDWLVDSDGAAYKIRHFAEATGMLAEYEKGELPSHAMVGKTGRCQIVIRKDRDGNYPDKNAIADYVKATGTTPVEKIDRELDDEIPF